jgi:hypothetical protein
VSITVVPTCSARQPSASSEMFLCSPWTTKRGQLRVAKRPAFKMPSITLAVSRTSVTKPTALVAYQRNGPCKKEVTVATLRNQVFWPL